MLVADQLIEIHLEVESEKNILKSYPLWKYSIVEQIIDKEKTLLTWIEQQRAEFNFKNVKKHPADEAVVE